MKGAQPEDKGFSPIGRVHSLQISYLHSTFLNLKPSQEPMIFGHKIVSRNKTAFQNISYFTKLKFFVNKFDEKRTKKIEKMQG